MRTRAVDRRRAQAVAAAAHARATAAGLHLPATLRIWGLAGWSPTAHLAAAPAPEVATVDAPEAAAPEIAVVLEQATPSATRRAQGLHVTPRWLADHIVHRCLADLATAPAPAGITVCDPACGGGAFLLAAARALHEQGMPRVEVVGRLWGADVDAVGVAAAEVALALWAGVPPPPGQLVVGDALAIGAKLWPGRPAEGFAVVVGNPPFLNQLGRATTRSTATTERLKARFGSAVRAYTDAAWLFLLLGCDLVRDGGRVGLIQPVSVVAARDAAAVRTSLAQRSTLRELWVEDRDQRAFAASVRVCAPVLAKVPPTGRATPVDAEWADRLADAAGVPAVDVELHAVERLGDRATVAAGFRDEYYGLVPLVRESAGSELPRLVTTGSLDWGRGSWGERPTVFAKRTWHEPVVDVAGVVPGRGVRRWIERTAGPKLLVANQTRVVELAVDDEGLCVPSVPTIAVVPFRPDDLWLLAAAVASPTATAWLWRRAPGTALSRDALKIAAPDLAELPLPTDDGAWLQAADAFRDFVSQPSVAAFDVYTGAAAAAYRADPTLVAWWRARVTLPTIARSSPASLTSNAP